MSMFNNASNFSIHGGSFTSLGQKGIDLLHEHIAPGAFHNSRERYDPPKCHPQTRVAVIQAIIAWIEDGQKTSFIKWLYGPAGAGKSAIAQQIAELYYQSGCLAASFFWSRSAAGRNNEERLIASLAYQLFLAIPEMRVHVEQAIEHDPALLSRSLEAQMEALVLEPLKKTFPVAFRLGGREGPVYAGHTKLIILDGLDECGTSKAQQYILKVISNFVCKFPIPLLFLIASRPEQAIRDSFNAQPLLSITARLALDDMYRPDDDIMLFLVESFESLKRTHTLRSHLPPAWPTTAEVQQLVRKSSGQFIYAATVIKFATSPRCRPDEQLDIILGITSAGDETPFAEVDALYSHIFSSVEDLPRALEVLSCLFLIDFFDGSSTDQLEKILSYRPGDLQLILIDLHSVLDISDVGDKSEICVLHASLQDFLMDPTRSGSFYIDKGKAHACIAQHFLQYMHNSSEPKTWDSTLILGLADQCLMCSITRELLADFFNFDFLKWVSRLFNFKRELGQWTKNMWNFYQVFKLYKWFGDQEANVQEYFGPGKSLHSHHSCSWEMAIDFMCDEIFDSYLDEHTNSGENAITAITHPHIAQHCHNNFSPFEEVIGAPYIDWCNSEAEAMELMLEIQKYLQDPERAGRCFVDGGMYTALSVQVIQFLIQFQEQNILGNNNKADGKVDNNNKAFQFAIETLPFYLSNADCAPELDSLANSLLGHINAVRQDELCNTIDLYLKKRLQEPSCQPTEENEELVNLRPEESISTSTSPDRYFTPKKRRRRTEESIEVNDVASPTPPPLLPVKRLRMLGPLNPTTDPKS